MGMAGELVPFVMIPRFTSYFGTSEFTTVALDVSAFQGGSLTLWRGKLIGGGAFALYTETSHDGYTWFGYPPGPGGTPLPWNPGNDGSVSVGLAFTRRYFRVRIVLTGTDPAVTCWATGLLEYRIDA